MAEVTPKVMPRKLEPVLRGYNVAEPVKAVPAKVVLPKVETVKVEPAKEPEIHPQTAIEMAYGRRILERDKAK